MFPGSENKHCWRPACSLEAMRRRAELYGEIRRYFAGQGVLEVETPLLYPSIGPDPQIHFFEWQDQNQTRYLQTSPEFAMKRLLAAGSGSIFQICKAFRKGEQGRLHNPEFTLLEWYRVGFDLDQMMAEVANLLRRLLGAAVKDVEFLHYPYIFHQRVGVEWDAPIDVFCERAEALGLPEGTDLCGNDRILWLDFLFSHVIQPQLPAEKLVFVDDYPAPLAALARLKPDNVQLAERFEVFLNSLELANGYRELTDPIQQRQRFLADQQTRARLNLPVPPLDESFLAALESGLPECSGVAVGLDRILMLSLGKKSIQEVITFPDRSPV
ncbi:MAG: hypothetical protein AXA67_04835 [Methylothermaceae bacteria B42]|nr:MAG: hypothetical protein AXA67_04835 [Methylothermaceae bacteria B42]HHJ40013.1 EF-P lysine aminoacylase GenX [Methylothermaceae bacterium]